MYRSPAEVETEPGSSWLATAREGVFGHLRKHKEPYVGASVFLSIILGLVVAFYAADAHFERERVAHEAHAYETRPLRQHMAEEWMLDHEIDGVATCLQRSDRCDVVPRDARAPFSVDCGGAECVLVSVK